MRTKAAAPAAELLRRRCSWEEFTSLNIALEAMGRFVS